MNATEGAATPSTGRSEPSGDNAALIGGVVGGVFALLLVGGLGAFLVIRSRRRNNQLDNNTAMANTIATPSNYGRISPNLDDNKHYQTLAANEL
jgi:hypothetical protein